MKSQIRTLSLLVSGLLLIGAVPPAHAQLLNKVKETAKRAAERETLKQVDRKVSSAVQCALEDQACIEQAKRDGKEVQVVNGAATSPSGGAATPSGSAPAAFVNFDFVPGERILFADDFGKDKIGDFPRRLELKSGNVEVAEVGGTRFVRCTSHPCEVHIPLPEVLPERFTLEFEMTGPNGWHQDIYFSDRNDAVYLYVRPDDGGLLGPKNYRVVSQPKVHPGKEVFPVKVMADGKYVKAYMNGTRISNAPNAEIGRARKIRFVLKGTAERPALMGNLRIAAGGQDLYDALSEKGRVATQGIYFDTGSDKIRPESTPTLNEITTMLKEHGDLKLVIEGHTDNVGNASANQALSARRAAAVQAHLVSQGIDASRLQSKGLGASKPAGSNDTPEGRQQNRRVELVRL